MLEQFARKAGLAAERPVPGPNAMRRVNIVRFLAAGILAVSLGLAGRTLSASSIPVDDFVEYWAAGRIALEGGNPYDSQQMWSVEKEAGRAGEQAIMMWNPPWVIPLIAPMGLMSYPLARMVWLALGMVATVVAVDWCWILYGGKPEERWRGLLIGFLFGPAVVALVLGQISPLLLVGAAGFLHWEKRGNPWLAGGFLALLMAKPQTALLVWVSLVPWSLRKKDFRALAGAGVVLLGSAALILWHNPEVWGQYLDAMRGPEIRLWATHTLGWLLRSSGGGGGLWRQFVPLACGLAWLSWYWHRNKVRWEWVETMPVLLLVSLVVSPYAWIFDQVVLLVPILQVFLWLRGHAGRRRLYGYVAFGVVYSLVILVPPVLSVSRGGRLYEAWYVFLALSTALLAGLYLLAKSRLMLEAHERPA